MKKKRSTRQELLQEAIKSIPLPMFWLLGKTGSGKSSIVKFLTGADPEIGVGFEPCTQFSQEYYFPSSDAPIMRFLDTQGLSDPQYDPAEDIKKFNQQAHAVIVTVQLTDPAQGDVIQALRAVRENRPDRKVILALTRLHQACPHKVHPQPYPFGNTGREEANEQLPEELRNLIVARREQFAGLFDRLVPLDITKPVDGFPEPNYGGSQFLAALHELLPDAEREALMNWEALSGAFADEFSRRAAPYIWSYAVAAATAGGMPVPLISWGLEVAIQTAMIAHIARVLRAPLEWDAVVKFGLGGVGASGGFKALAVRGFRELSKLVPFAGAMAMGGCAIVAGASTYALGAAYVWYVQSVRGGHVPSKDEIDLYRQAQLTEAKKLFRKTPAPGDAKAANDPN